MFAKKIYQWNAVDVVRSSGEVHRGLVVGKQKANLLVDFDVTGKEPELVPYQNAYLGNDCTSRRLVKVERTGDAVIIMKLSKDQPWKWYSGRVLYVDTPYGCDGLELVKIQIGDEVVTKCVRSDCVRRQACSGRLVRKNDFVKEECSVPDEFSYDEQSLAAWRNRFPRTHPIGIVDNTFQFLQLRYDQDFDVSEMASALSDGIIKQEEMDTTEDSRGVKRPYDCIINDEEKSSVTADFCMNDLPSNILGIVFSFLDGRQQTRMRLVCPAWNSKIISPECSIETVVDLSSYQEEEDPYVLGAWFFHCITEWTKYVTITFSSAMPWCGINMPMLILRKVIKCKNPLTALILRNVHLEPENILTNSRTAIAQAMRRVCGRLIFKDVTILYLFNPKQNKLASHLVRRSDEELRIAFGSVRVDSQKELLDCFEAAATDFADPKHHDTLERVSKVIVQANGGDGHSGDKDCQNQIVKVLKDWQSVPYDIRFGSSPEWKHVQLAQLSANLLTLRSTTLAALACLAKRWKLKGSDDGELHDDEDDYHHEQVHHYSEDSDGEFADAYDGW